MGNTCHNFPCHTKHLLILVCEWRWGSILKAGWEQKLRTVRVIFFWLVPPTSTALQSQFTWKTKHSPNSFISITFYGLVLVLIPSSKFCYRFLKQLNPFSATDLCEWIVIGYQGTRDKDDQTEKERQWQGTTVHGLPGSSSCPWSRTVLISAKRVPENAMCHLSAAESGSGVPGGRRSAKRHHPDGTGSPFWCMTPPLRSFWQHSQ